MSAATRILVIRLSSIGDIVLTTPVVRALKNQLEGEVDIHYLVKNKFSNIVLTNPYITRIHTFEKTVQEVLPELEKIGFDYIIDLHNNIRSTIVKRRLKSLAFTFRKLNFQKWLLVNFGINRMPDLHIVDRYMETLKAFGVKDDGKGLDYFIPEGTQVNELPEKFRDGYVALSISAMHIGKSMSAETLLSICMSGYPVVLLGAGDEDYYTGEYLVGKAGDLVYNACNSFSIHQSALCIREARVVVSGDSGMMHIASAFQKKIVSVWGCTSPLLGMYPYRPHPESIMIEPHDRNKRPCSKLGDRCKYATKDKLGRLQNLCIDTIQGAEINAAIEKLWAL